MKQTPATRFLLQILPLGTTLRKATSLLLSVAIVATFSPFALMPSAFAANTITPTTLISAPTYYKASSGVKAVIKLVITGDESGDYLSKLNFTFSGAGWDAADIVDLDAAPASSGVGLYLDDGNGTFDGGDTAITTSGQTNASWAGGGAASLSYALSGDTQMGTGSLTYFVTIQTDSTLDDTDAITFTLDSVKLQAVTEAVGTSVSFVGDTTQPAISAVETQDLDANGKIDALKLTYGATEYLDDSTIAITDYTYTPVGTEALDGAYSSTIGAVAFTNGIGTGTANDNIVYLKLSEGNSTTSTRGTLASSAGVVSDLAGNTSAVYGATQVTDKAKPVLLSAVYLDLDTNGAVDTIRTTWSENVTMSGSTAVDWTVGTGTLGATFSSAADDAVAGTTLDVTITGDAGETSSSTAVTIAYDDDDTNNSVVDAATSPNAATTNAAVTATDSAGPQIVSVRGNAGTDTLAVVLSEAAYDSDDSGLDVADFSITITGGQTITASDHVAGASTLNLTLSGVLNVDGTDYNGDTVTASTNVQDASNNSADNTRNVAITDATAPTITSATTADTNSDGTVDQLTVVFSESVDIVDSNTNTAGIPGIVLTNSCDFSAADYTSSDVTSKVFTLTGCTAGNTAITPTFTYDADGASTIYDNGSSPTEMADNEAETAVDGAKPAIISSVTADSNSNGTIDQLTLTFSESVTVTDGGSDNDITLTASSGTATIDAGTYGTTGTTVTYNITPSATGDTSLTINPTYATAGAGSIVDAATNEMANAETVTGTDGAKPIIKTVTIEDTNTNGLIDKLTYTWSENIDTDDGAAPVAADLPTTIMPDGTTAAFAGVTISDPAGAAATVVVTVITDQVTRNTGAGNTAISGDLSAKWVDGSANTPHATGATGNESVVDSAAPVLLAAKIRDDAANGVFDAANDKLVLVFSEGVTALTAANAETDFIFGSDGADNIPNDATVSQSQTTILNDTITYLYNATPSGNMLGTYGVETVDVNTGSVVADSIEDSSGNDLVDTYTGLALTSSQLDETAPTITARETQDLDADGKIDAIKITFDDTVQDSTVNAANFDVAGYTGEAFSATTNGDSANDSVIYITFTEGSSDTGITPNLTYTAGTLVDDSNNALATNGPTATTDKAAPVAVSSAYKDINADGSIDRVDITFSENITLDEYDDADFAVTTPGSITLADETAAATSTTDLRLTVSADANETGSATAPVMSYTAANGTANSLNDGTNNVADFSTGNISDAAAPVVASASFYDATSSDGKLDKVIVNWSENISAVADNSADWAISSAANFAALTEGTVESNSGAAAANQTIYNFTTSTAKTSVGDLTLAYTAGTSITDGTNAATSKSITSASSPAFTDAAAPVITGVQEFDVNTDGKVDETVLTYSESILDASVTPADYTIGGVAADAKMATTSTNGTDTNVADDNVITIKVTAGVTGTGQKAVVYTAGATTDANAVSAATQTFIAGSVTDSALPQLSSKTYTDNGSDGSVDRLVLGFSEPVTWNGSDLDQVSVTANDLTAFAGNPSAISGSGTSSLTLTMSATSNLTGVSGGTEPQVAFVQSGTAGNRIKDISSNELASFGLTSITDAANPVVVSKVYEDANTDGTVDRITLTFSESAAAPDAVVGDFALTANDLTGAALGILSYPSVTTARITLTGAPADTTGAATAPQIAYTDGGATAIADATGNQLATFVATNLTDAAAPVYVSSQTIDNNNDGTVDYVKVVYSEPVSDASVSAADFRAGTVDTTAAALTESFTSLTPSSGNLTDTADDATIYIGVASGTTTLTANKTDYTLHVEQVGAVADAASNSLATFAEQTSADAARPIVISGTYKDINADAMVDRLDITFSENLTKNSYTDASYTVSTSGSINLTDESATAVSGADLQLTVTADADITGGTTAPAVSYATVLNELEDATGNDIASFGPLTLTDGAAPMPINVTSSKGLSNGNLQNGTVLTTTFSEPITVTSGSVDVTDNGSDNAGSDISVIIKPDGSNADYVITGLNDATARFSQGAANQLLITSNAATSVGTFLTQAKLNVGNGAGIVDSASNVAVAYSSDRSISGLIGPAVDAIATATVASTSTTLSWITFANTTSNYIKLGTNPEALSQLTTVSTPAVSANDLGTASTVHSGSVTGLSASTFYYYQVCSTLVSETCSDIHNFVTTASSGDSTAPTPTVSVTNVTTTTADIIVAVDESSDYRVLVDNSNAFGSPEFTSAYQATTAAGPFTVSATGLTANTTYYVQVRVSDQASGAGNIRTEVYAFTTNQLNAAVLSNVVPTADATNPSTKVTIAWVTQNDVAGEPTGSLNTTGNLVQYGTTQALGSSQASSTGDGVSSHSASLTGLTANTTYYYRVKSIANGKTSYSQIFTFATTSGDNGLYIDSITAVKSYASYSAGTPWTSGWHFRFAVTADNASDRYVRMKFDNWVSSASGATALAVSGNTKVITSATGSTSDEATIAAGTSLVTSYASGTTIDTNGITDGNATRAGKQFYIDVYVKIPAASGYTGSYSTSYGVKNQSSDATWTD